MVRTVETTLVEYTVMFVPLVTTVSY